ncbi:MAG: hypothetical protein ACLGH3_02725 [Actinomycetota bacterium]
MSGTVVVVAHDDETVRSSLVEVLEADPGLVVGAADRSVDLDAWPGAVLVAGANKTGLSRSAPVVVVADGDPVPAVRHALSIGAAGFVVWPEESDRLATEIRSAAIASAARTGPRAGRIIAVAGTRGGLGTTTLAAWIARSAGAVRLVELDPRGTVSRWCQGEPGDLAKVLRDPDPERLASEGTPSRFDVALLAGRPRDAGASQTLLGLLRATGDVQVLDLGLIEASDQRAWSQADARVLLVGDDTSSVAVAHRNRRDAIWVARMMARSGIRVRDMQGALGSSPRGTLRNSRRVAHTTDLGRLAPTPRCVQELATEVADR